MLATQTVFTLQMRYPFGISRSVSTESKTILLRLGDLGQGEASPVKYRKQTVEMTQAILDDITRDVSESSLDDIEYHDARARKMYPFAQSSAAICALNLALWDARGRREGAPVYKLVGGSAKTAPTTYTVSLSEVETMELRAREAAHLPLLKVKLGRGLEHDTAAIRAVRKAAPNSILRVDANAGWTLEVCRAIMPVLQECRVEFIEQPLTIGNLDDLKILTRESPLPIVADEDAQDLASLDKLRGRVHGINIKLMKCGGISEALKMISYARREGWKVMVGCMLETRLALGAMAHLGALVDAIDLDAHMLTKNDPYPQGSVEIPEATPPLADGPGLGLPFPNLG